MDATFQGAVDFVLRCHEMREAGDKDIENHPAYRAAMNYVFLHMAEESPELSARIREGFNRFFPGLAAKGMVDSDGNKWFRLEDIAEELGASKEELLSLAQEVGEPVVQVDPADLHTLN
jgi:hypothetical protein